MLLVVAAVGLNMLVIAAVGVGIDACLLQQQAVG